MLKVSKAPESISIQDLTGAKKESDSKESLHDKMLGLCANELIMAVNAKDSKKVVEAMRAMFQMLDAEPHVEGEHLEEEEMGV